MLLRITTTHEPATDLGFLLVKHPGRVHSFRLPSGTAYVCFPEATAQRCTAALILEVDPSRLTAGRRNAGAPTQFSLAPYVNDRPYAASSLMSAALARVFRSAMRGDSRDAPELAGRPIPLEIHLPVLRCRGGAGLVESLFAPLGWTVRAEVLPLDETHPEWGESRYVALNLTATVRLADALNHIYVLLPVLDDAKHYWVAPDEVDKLLRAGVGWLAGHPQRDLIARRYLAHRRALAQEAIERIDALARADEVPLSESVDDTFEGAETDSDEEAGLPPAVPRVPLAEQRRQAVLAALAESAPKRVLDLGCGTGTLLADLLKASGGWARSAGGRENQAHSQIVGVDISAEALQIAHRRLRLDRYPGRVTLLQSALTYTDDRLQGFDAAVLMEVIEHLDPPRLPALAATVFGHARPSTVVITTPNVEYNTRYEGMPEGALRHHDHRFEWTRAEFAAWCTGVGQDYGYQVDLRGVGEADPEVGHPTQLAVFRR